MSVAEATRALCEQVLELDLDPDTRARVLATRERLDGPLRVALAGRVKAGKSTLLNALVGERLAPTDAGECTRIVSWYREGLGYGVSAELLDGEQRQVEFRRNGELHVELGELTPESVRRLVVDWPSDRLAATTLIDTPGLASLDRVVSDRTLEALGTDGRGAPDADAVVYLMRHLHRVDADFLEGFVTGSDAGASPVNSIAVLSRADEIGAGRLDAMQSARSVAAAYERDGRTSALSSQVVAVAGLVAETAQTLTESEFHVLRRLASLPDALVEALLLSVDRFVDFDPDGSVSAIGVDRAEREQLVNRFGLFGLRFSIERIRSGSATSTALLAAALLVVSGLDDLRAALDGHIRPRAEVLQARSALLVLADVADGLAATDEDAAAGLARSLEEVVSAAHEFSELRLAHVVATGMTMLGRDDVTRAARLSAPGRLSDRLGVAGFADADDARARLLTEIEHWRATAANPAFDPVTVEACDIAARCAEGLYVSVAAS
jgi:hypothetical protein